MATKTKLLLIPCSQEETLELAQDILQILREGYSLNDQVEILTGMKRNEVSQESQKNHKTPLVCDYFGDVEAQIDIGRNQLKDVIRGKHIVLIEHLLTPNRRISQNSEQLVSVNDHIMTVRGSLNVISKVETLQRTIVAPYLTYVRSHSVEKYEASGFFQFDSLRTTLDDLCGGGVNVILTIDAHSEKAPQIASELGMEFHNIDPFQSARAINPKKLGLSDEKAEAILKNLRPFHERFVLLKQQNPEHLYVVSVDDGTEKRAENFIERAFPKLPPFKLYKRLAYLDKARYTYDNFSLNAHFKTFSEINENNIDKEGTYIIIDDMYSSGGTSNSAAKILKKLGAKRVEVWVSHAVTMPHQIQKANDRSFIDKVTCLDTVPQNQNLDVEYITASANLLAAEIYKIHKKLEASR